MSSKYQQELKNLLYGSHLPNTSIHQYNANSNANQLITQLICITNNECLMLHHKAFRADHIWRSTKIRAPRSPSAARILVLREF